MFNFYDIAYWIGLGAASPYWLIKQSAREKVLRTLRERMGDVARRESDSPAIWIHAVSVGEINATGALIEGLRREKPELQFIVSTTTQTGFARGEQLYSKSAHVQLIKYPLDFSSAVCRALDLLRPSVVVLMELEIWPNFVWRCKQRGIPVIIVNGRITEPSFKKYMLLGPVTKRMLRRIDRICVQDETYAGRFISMGALRESVEITGTMKFDTAEVADHVEGDRELAAMVGLRHGSEPDQSRVPSTPSPGTPGEGGGEGFGGEHAVEESSPSREPSPYPSTSRSPRTMAYRAREGNPTDPSLSIAPKFQPIWVCGSTGPGEEQIILAEYRALLVKYPGLRLAIIPRHPQRFDEVAELIRREGFDVLRRSRTTTPVEPSGAVVLGDTMGELRKFYSLADVVFVGRSLVDLGARQHGSDMIEPAALGKAVIVGPFTANFAEAMEKLLAGKAVVDVKDGGGFREAIRGFLEKPEESKAMGRRAQEVVRSEKGATGRHCVRILDLMEKLKMNEESIARSKTPDPFD